MTLFEIVTSTLWAIKNHVKNSEFSHILESEEKMFERGSNVKGRKKIKTDFS